MLVFAMQVQLMYDRTTMRFYNQINAVKQGKVSFPKKITGKNDPSTDFNNLSYDMTRWAQRLIKQGEYKRLGLSPNMFKKLLMQNIMADRRVRVNRKSTKGVIVQKVFNKNFHEKGIMGISSVKTILKNLCFKLDKNR